MQKESTKFFSSRQEKQIADYLSWDVVSGSGARFKPGDVTSGRWLGECKTHETARPNIQFFKKEWDKIYKEATSQLKTPVLFVDDGSLTIQHTWCMLPAAILPPAEPSSNFTIDAFPYTVRTNVVLPAVAGLMKYYSLCREYRVDVVCWQHKDIVVMPIFNFRVLLEEYFGC